MVSQQVIIQKEQGEALPAGFNEWLDQGRALYNERKALDWKCADWLADGQARFPKQMALALQEFATDPIEQKLLTRSAKIAAAIPASQRDAALTFAHHMHVADLPADERLALLNRAAKERLSARALRIVAMERKAVLGVGNTQLEDDDPEYQALMAIVRAWNRAPRETREEFYDMAGDAELGVIEA